MSGKYLIRTYMMLLCTCSSLFNSKAAIAEKDEQVLIDKFRFYFVGNPNDSRSREVLLDNKAINMGTEAGTFWRNGSMNTAQELVRSLLKSGENGGDVSLQEYASAIIKLLNKPVQVWLYDDTSAKLNAVATQLYDPCLDTNDRVWPCAANTPDEQNWAGFLHLGAVNMNAYGIKWTKATLLHELVHTQDQSDSRGHIFSVRGRDWSYGADSSHHPYEALPNMALTYAEGIANTISYLYDGIEAGKAFQWFADNDLLIVETVVPTGPAATLSIHKDIFLYDKIKAVVGEGAPLQGADWAGYRGYHIRDLPSYFIIHNEQILALIFSEYVHHVGFSRFLDALHSSNNQLLKVCASGVAILFQRLCEQGILLSKESALGSNQDGSKTAFEGQVHLLPLAYADYFTSYKSGDDKEAFSRIFENMLPDDWIDLYWDSGARTATRLAAPIGAGRTLKQSDLTLIAQALGIHQSIAD